LAHPYKRPLLAFQRPIFPQIDLNHIPKTGGLRTLLYCRAGSPVNLIFLQKRRFPKTFLGAWTSFPLQPEIGIAGLAIRAFYGVIFLQVCLGEGYVLTGSDKALFSGK
jgi:hypothetical protein